LLRAYRQLRRRNPVATPPLLLVGNKGWLYDEIFAAIESLGLGADVIHLEGVADWELNHLYQRAALLALPSWYEGFGLPVLEAMHSGCPVIASDRASLPEVVGGAGLLLDAEDVDAWADGLDLLLHDEWRREALVRAGYKQAANFTWQKTALATLDLYLGVM
jgi:glycosyltransferase involved in cell wall biosynthesis